MENNSISFVFFLGKGGAGKDTQMNLLIEKMREDIVFVVPTGDMFRDALNNSGKYAKYHEFLRDCLEDVKNGSYIPDQKISEIVKKEVEEGLSLGKTIFMFPGFPRTVGQVDMIDQIKNILSSEKFNVSFDFIYYEISDKTVRNRSEERSRIAIENGQNPRKEDRPEAVEKKLKEFYEKTVPMLQKIMCGEYRLAIIDGEQSVFNIEAETTLRIFGGGRKERK